MPRSDRRPARPAFLRARLACERLEDRLAPAVLDVNTGNSFTTIQAAIDDATTLSGHTLQIDDADGVYTEAVRITKSLTLVGLDTSAAGRPTVTAPSGSNQRIFDVQAANVTIRGLDIIVNQPNAATGIYADQTHDFDGLQILDNTITTTGSGASSPRGVFLQQTGTAKSVTLQGNTFSAASGFSFSRGVELREQINATVGGTGSGQGNTFGGAYIDLHLNFLSSVTASVQGNTFTSAVATGAGINVTEPLNSTVNISGNQFAPSAAAAGYRGLFINHNYSLTSTITADGNTFTEQTGTVGVLSAASRGVVLTNNTFSAVSGATSFSHVVADTQMRSGTQYGPFVTNTLTLQGNTFNGVTGTPAGTALAFYNGNSTGQDPDFSAVIGGAGTLANTFNAGLAAYITLNSTQDPLFTAASAPAALGPVADDFDASQNLFAVTGGVLLPSAMSGAQRVQLEDRTFHQPDSAVLGRVDFGGTTAAGLTVTPNPAGPGQSVTFTARLVLPAGPAPTGSVEFRNGSTVLGSSSTFTLVGGTYQATFSTAAFPPGTYPQLRAVYSGDSNYAAATTPDVTLVVRAPAPPPPPHVPGGLVIATPGGGVHLLTPPAGSRALPGIPGWPGTLRTALGDLNRDGVADVVVAAGAGGFSHVMAYDGRTGAVLYSFFAFPGFQGGVNVAVGDVDGDGFGDIVAAADAGASPHVRVFSGDPARASGVTPAEAASFLAYAPAFAGGVRVAVGDVDGDGRAEIVTGTVHGAPHIRVFDGRGNARTDLGNLGSFLAFDPRTDGVFVAVGDVGGDGVTEIIAGAGSGAAHVRLFNRTRTGLEPTALPGVFVLEDVLSFIAFDAPVAGVRVAAVDWLGTGAKDIAVAPADPLIVRPRVLRFDGLGDRVDPTLLGDVTFLGGITLGGL